MDTLFYIIEIVKQQKRRVQNQVDKQTKRSVERAYRRVVGENVMDRPRNQRSLGVDSGRARLSFAKGQ